MVDRATGYSETSLMLSRCMEHALRMIETKWFDTHVPLSSLSGDPEFNKGKVHTLCAEYNIQYEARPARRHNKIGTVESAHSSIGFIVQRLQKDDVHFCATRPEFRPASDYELLSTATFLKEYALWE